MEFVFLSRFWGNARKEGSRILILRSAIASTSHLKIKENVARKIFELRRFFSSW